ncbi:TauD/TfdA family dioxygenase [Streptomyces orinoci]|uniref:TauD/TfdA family dioxygenase n=1 Tax=Streptomyces orinoci TaxID=67339 RepID=A0ABV3JUR9_STRON|nr:TauD/TfdA family dioxygenase [Streptomyces orinoci]
MRKADPFWSHYLHIHSPRAQKVIEERLQQSGLVILDGFSTRRAVIDFAERIMDLTPHRDSDPDGLTTIRDTRRHAHLAGYAGLTNGEVAPHTERAGIPTPPRLMLMVCGTPAAHGGTCLLTDGRSVHTEIAARMREVAVALAKPRTAFFGAADGHATQVFTEHPDGRVSLRLRLDGLARFSPLVQPHLPMLRAVLSTHQIPLKLAAGQGYLLDNHRWLHARTAFTGLRLFWRALGEPRFVLPRGFAPLSGFATPSATSAEGLS